MGFRTELAQSPLAEPLFDDSNGIFATKGINAFTLRDLLSHTSTRTTERYARPSIEALDAVRVALG